MHIFALLGDHWKKKMKKKLPAALLFADFRKPFFSIIMIYKKKTKRKNQTYIQQCPNNILCCWGKIKC